MLPCFVVSPPSLSLSLFLCLLLCLGLGPLFARVPCGLSHLPAHLSALRPGQTEPFARCTVGSVRTCNGATGVQLLAAKFRCCLHYSLPLPLACARAPCRPGSTPGLHRELKYAGRCRGCSPAACHRRARPRHPGLGRRQQLPAERRRPDSELVRNQRVGPEVQQRSHAARPAPPAARKQRRPAVAVPAVHLSPVCQQRTDDEQARRRGCRWELLGGAAAAAAATSASAELPQPPDPAPTCLV